MMQLILDVETKKTFDQVGGYFPEKLGISYVGVCVRNGYSGTGEMLGFFEDQLNDLWPLLEQAEIIVGFNIIGFDMETLRPYYSGNVERLPVLDLLERFKKSTGHRVSLDSIAQQTLGKGKIGHGLDAIKYYENKEFDKLAKYCLMDVEITREVWDFGLQHGKVKFTNKWNRVIEAPVDFSFARPKEQGVQMTLL